MKQLQIDLPKPLHSGDFALGGLAAYGVPNQEQAAQQWGGYGMDFDDARTEISHPESHPDSESSASSFRGNRAAPSHATSIGSSRPCQPPKGRPRPNQVGGNNHPVLQAEIDCLLTHIVEEQQNEMMTGNVVLPWTEIARKLNECGYIRENNLSKTSKYCRDRCDPLCLVTRPAAGAAPPPAPRPHAPSLSLLLVTQLSSTDTHPPQHHLLPPVCQFARPGVRTTHTHRWTDYANPKLNLKKSTTEEDALIMEAVKIHGTKWTEIAKMWIVLGRSARTAAWPKYPHQRAGLLVAQPHHTIGSRSTRLCSRGQPPPPR